jgi:hypothetical protein
MQYFDVILPGEKNVLTFNLAPALLNGNILTGTPTVTVTTYSGIDPDPTAILNGSPQLDSTNTQVLVPVAPTVNGVQYLIDVFVDTQLPTVLPGIQGILPVRFGS